MAAPPTTTVEIDSRLLERPRGLNRRKSDHELLEELAVIAVGEETVRRVHKRNPDADPDEVMAESVRAARGAARDGG